MLIAVDTSVLLDQALGDREVIDALETIKWRLANPGIYIPPTALEDLAWQNENGNAEEKAAASTALRNLLDWGYNPVNLIPAGHGIVEQIAFKMRSAGCLPEENETDALILAESALIGCSILLSNSAALLQAADSGHLGVILEESEVQGDGLKIYTPQDMVARFFPANK